MGEPGGSFEDRSGGGARIAFRDAVRKGEYQTMSCGHLGREQPREARVTGTSVAEVSRRAAGVSADVMRCWRLSRCCDNSSPR
jgi:hypothetical protein